MDGLRLLTWMQESFAYADSYDELVGRYRGLHCGQAVHILDSSMSGMLVKPDVALKQQNESIQPIIKPPVKDKTGNHTTTGAKDTGSGVETTIEPGSKVQLPKCFYGKVTLDPTRVGRDGSVIADEVISHLAGLVGSKVTVTLEIEAEVPSGVPENVVRTVTENSRTLKFESQGFERE